MPVVDFHTHILPGIDDGSHTVAESVQMLELERMQGIDIIVATPHFYGEKDRIDRFLSRRNGAVEQLEAAAGNQLFDLRVGAEVCFFSGISAAGGIERLCIEGTDLLLLELPFDQWDANLYWEVELLARRYKLILAHIERYTAFQSDKSVFRDVLALPVYGQCNAGPLLRWRQRGQVVHFFKSGQAQLLGSDCHNLSHRVPNLAQGRAVLQHKIGKECLEKMDELGGRLLL